MTKVYGQSFDKYRIRGAYHWEAISRSLRQHNAFVNARYELVVKALRRSTAKNVLDIGCGDGALSYLIHKSGHLVAGIDPENEAIAIANAKFKELRIEADFQVASAYEVPFTNEHFDAVICADVIEHVKEPDRLISEIARVLKTGGLAIITTPIATENGLVDPLHVREFTPDELKLMVSSRFDRIELELSHPAHWVKRYKASKRLLLDRRPWKAGINFLDTYLKINPFTSPKGTPTNMSLCARKS